MHKYIYACVMLTVIPGLVPAPLNWDASYIVFGTQCAILATCWCLSTPYTNLRLKSLLAAFSAFSWLDVALYPVRYLMPPYIVYSVEVAIAFIFLLYIYNKWYSFRSEPLEDEFLFVVSKKPSSFIELIVSIFCSEPSGGFSVYAKDWYHFRKKSGTIEKADGCVLKELADDYVFHSVCRLEKRHTERLESMIGLKWTPFRNCISEFKSFDRG